jgi:PIN domain nuclease of toxin-antitoxin system
MSSRLLLDTHVALWSLSAPGKLRTAVRRDIERGEVFVSAASIWEIAIKSAIGKLKADPRAVLDELPVAGFGLLPIWVSIRSNVVGASNVRIDDLDQRRGAGGFSSGCAARLIARLA